MTGHRSHKYDQAIKLLKTARQEAGLTQVHLAERIGTRQQFVSKYESKERRLDIIEYFEVAAALRIDHRRILDVCLADKESSDSK